MKQPTNVTYLVITFPYLTINLNPFNRAFCHTTLKTKTIKNGCTDCGGSFVKLRTIVQSVICQMPQRFPPRGYLKNAWNAIAEELRVEDSTEVEKEFKKSREK